MNLLNLLWIIPVSYTIGLITAVFYIEAKMSDEELEEVYGETFGPNGTNIR